MREFVIQGVSLNLPDRLLTPTMTKAFESGRYEAAEARQLPRFLREGDRLLELGGGIGFISTLANRTTKLSACIVIEANPELIETIKDNHQRNGVVADVRNAVALSRKTLRSLDKGESGSVPFYLRRSFWGSSMSPQPDYYAKVATPALDFQTLLDEVHPSIIIADIEGGELNLFDGIDLFGVRHVFVEVHKAVIGLDGIAHVISTLSREGLHYDPDFSTGSIVMFSRCLRRDLA